VPLGCVAPDTLVITEFGPVPICEITSPVRVLSWNPDLGRYQLSLTGGAFPKGADYLYRVTTTRGELAVSGHHRIFCADGSYQRVDKLCRGQSVSLCSDDRLLSSSAYLSKLPSGEWHCSRKLADFAGRYAESARQYGQQLLEAEGIDQEFVPSQSDARECAQSGARKGGSSVPGCLHNHHDQCSGPLSMRGLIRHAEDRMEAGASFFASLPYEHNAESGQFFLRSLRKMFFRQPSELLSECSDSYTCSLSYGNIVKIERETVKRAYWDMQVFDTNNYVTVDGTIHHNSGKSVGMCWEVFLRARDMIPGEDGWKRSKWLVARNTLPQLETTTIETWLQWFPEHLFGRMNRKPPYHHHIKLADHKIDLNVVFLALDKPEDQRKLLSFEATGIWFNEAREMDYELISAATGRVGRYPSMRDAPDIIKNLGAKRIKFIQEYVVDADFERCRKKAKLTKRDAENFMKQEGFDIAWKWMTQRYIIMDTNPPDDENWWYKMAEEDAWAVDENGKGCLRENILPHNRWDFFDQPSGLSDEAENIENLKGGRNYYLQMMGGKSKEWIDIYVHGQYGFVKHGLAVYGRSWDDERHSVDDLRVNPNGKIYIGVDASGRHPAAVFAQKTMRGQWQILHELCVQDEEGMGAVMFSRLLKDEINREFGGHEIGGIWGDPAGDWRSQNDEHTYFDILRSNGIAIKSSPGLRIPDRTETVQAVLESNVDSQPKILVSRKCKILRRGFNGGYRYRKLNKSGDEAQYDPKPEKNRFSDVHDALQYLLTGAGEMQKIKRGGGDERKVIQAGTGFSVFG